MDHAIFCRIHLAHYRLRQYLRHTPTKKFRLFVKSTSPQNILATPLTAFVDRAILPSIYYVDKYDISLHPSKPVKHN